MFPKYFCKCRYLERRIRSAARDAHIIQDENFTMTFLNFDDEENSVIVDVSVCVKMLTFLIITNFYFLDGHWCLFLQFQDHITAANISTLDGLDFLGDPLKFTLLHDEALTWKVGMRCQQELKYQISLHLS